MAHTRIDPSSVVRIEYRHYVKLEKKLLRKIRFLDDHFQPCEVYREVTSEKAGFNTEQFIHLHM